MKKGDGAQVTMSHSFKVVAHTDCEIVIIDGRDIRMIAVEVLSFAYLMRNKNDDQR